MVIQELGKKSIQANIDKHITFRKQSGGMEETCMEEDFLKTEIEDFPVVSSVTFHRATGRDKAGYHANLRCPSVSSHGGCTDGGCTVKQVGPICMSGQHPTLVDCLRDLKTLIMWDQGDNCVTAAQVWLAANHVDNMETKPDAMQVMMRFSAAKNRAKDAQDRANAANQVALRRRRKTTRSVMSSHRATWTSSRGG
jgi:hypothetical protein